MILKTRFLIQVIAVLLVPCVMGCTTSALNLGLGKPTKVEQETADNPVIQMVPVWQESEGPGVDNQVVSRGFGGQIYFITEERGLPSEVKGGIRVYVFDDQGTAEEQTKPIHQFDFEAEAWQMHSTMTKLGPAYTLFIPYTRPGRHLAQCALRIRYTPPNGPAIFSQMASLTLPGTKNAAVEGDPSDSERPKMSADGTLTLKSPKTPSPKGFKNSSITTVGAEEPQRPRRKTPAKREIQTADFDVAEDEVEIGSRVRAAHHEEESADEAEPEYDVESEREAELDREREIEVKRIAKLKKKTVVKKAATFADEDQEEPTVRTYSIPLD